VWTLFTRDFKKFRLVLTLLLSTLLVYVVLNLCLLCLADWAETRANTYPYRSEDWLRYLLPTMINTDSRNRLFLLGESAVRENLIYEQFNREFPGMDTFQGALSLGTLDDALLSLDYVKCVYGNEALPKVLVLGISPRFVANIPYQGSPLVGAIKKYSPQYSVEQTAKGSCLIPKTKLEGFVSRARFLLKQQARYHSALCAVMRHYVKEDVAYEKYHEDFPKMRAILGVLKFRINDFRVALEFIRQVGLRSALGRWLRVFISPYKYHYLPPMRPETIVEWLRDPGSFWVDVHAWDPQISESTIRFQFARLLEFTDRHKIQLYVVNLPENELSRSLYDPVNYQNYYNLVLDSLDNVPFLDLREMLSKEDFYDVMHVNLESALRVTDRVVEFIKNHQNGEHRTSDMVSLR
jgi:hypothetical protein